MDQSNFILIQSIFTSEVCWLAELLVGHILLLWNDRNIDLQFFQKQLMSNSGRIQQPGNEVDNQLSQQILQLFAVCYNQCCYIHEKGSVNIEKPFHKLGQIVNVLGFKTVALMLCFALIISHNIASYLNPTFDGCLKIVPVGNCHVSTCISEPDCCQPHIGDSRCLRDRRRQFRVVGQCEDHLFK